MRWFQFMGDARDNPYVPFQINYRAEGDNTTTEFTPLDPKTYGCSEALNVRRTLFKVRQKKIEMFSFVNTAQHTSMLVC